MKKIITMIRHVCESLKKKEEKRIKIVRQDLKDDQTYYADKDKAS